VDSLDEDVIPNPLGLTSSRAEVAAAANVVRGVGLVYEGLFDDARRSLEPALAAGHAFWQVSALGALGVLEAWSGALRAAEAAGTSGVSLAGQLGLDHQPVSADAYLALARVARERDQLDRAAELLAELMSRLPSNRRPSLTASAVTEQALHALANGQPETGLVAIAARRASEHHALPAAVLARRAAAEAQLLIANGDLDAASRVMTSAPALLTLELASAQMRLAVERGDLPWARAIADVWPDRPQPRAARELGLWRGILHNLSGDDAGARDEVASVVAAAEPDGDIGVFRAGGHHVLGPARSLYRAAPTPFLRAVVECPHAVSPIPKAQDLVEQLTDREVTVLALLPQHLSTAEIANRLDVSLNTVKTHLKHIYRKFGVANRTAAVEAAECMHIL
jgi:LuxR family maltose regulon positive regulatory protein